MQSLVLPPLVENIWFKFHIHFYQSYKYVRNSQIAAVPAGFNSANVVMKQEITNALNNLANSVSSNIKLCNIHCIV